MATSFTRHQLEDSLFPPPSARRDSPGPYFDAPAPMLCHDRPYAGFPHAAEQFATYFLTPVAFVPRAKIIFTAHAISLIAIR